MIRNEALLSVRVVDVETARFVHMPYASTIFQYGPMALTILKHCLISQISRLWVNGDLVQPNMLSPE